MAEGKRKSVPQQEPPKGPALDLEGFEPFFGDEADKKEKSERGATTGDMSPQIEKLICKIGELITFSVDQRVETAKLANQLIENQRQLVATQQILIRLMERSIELTRHITTIEEKLPAVFELPSTVESLRMRVAQMEGVELS